MVKIPQLCKNDKIKKMNKQNKILIVVGIAVFVALCVLIFVIINQGKQNQEDSMTKSKTDDKSAQTPAISKSTHNHINLGVAQKDGKLLAIFDGFPQSFEELEDWQWWNQEDLPEVRVRAFRNVDVSNCTPDLDIDSLNLYDVIPFENQHWRIDYTFTVGRYDIGQNVCLLAKDGQDTHTKAVTVESFTRKGPSIEFYLIDGKLSVFTESYLPVDVPAWEYIGPMSAKTDFSQTACNAQTFIAYNDQIVSKTFNSPQSFFDPLGGSNGFNHHNDPDNTIKLTISLTEADVDKVICFKIRNSFGEISYEALVVPEGLYLPMLIT